MTLYTPETFGGAATATLRHDLEAMSERLGVPLDPEKLSVAGLSPRRAEALQYEGAPLGQIGYLEGKIPVAFCVFRDGESDAPLTIASRSGFATASWAKGGRGFMLIGDLPADRIEALARVLQERIS
jgi:anti-sigma factor RsiW